MNPEALGQGQNASPFPTAHESELRMNRSQYETEAGPAPACECPQTSQNQAAAKQTQSSVSKRRRHHERLYALDIHAKVITGMLKQRHGTATRCQLGKSLAGVVMMALFSLLLAATLSQEIHHFFHCDAQSPHHQCAATQMAAGHLLEGPMLLSAPAPVWRLALLPLPSALLRLPAADVRLMPERAPPLLSL